MNKFTRAGIWAILEAAGMDHGKAVALTNEIIAALAAALATGEVIELRGFGSFELRERRAHKARNPRAGEAVDVPARKIIFFRPCRKLKAAINDPEEPGI
jgi:nucleoid DNA-binding protein